VSQFSPEVNSSQEKKSSKTAKWRVILYNDNRHKGDDVIDLLRDIAGCSADFAIKICHVCEDQGRAVCFQGDKATCHEVTRALRSHGLQVEVDDY
jgi:ATP-dependent Clp protease adapter protein ClpS